MTESIPLTWEEVARVYGKKIYNFAYRLTGNSNDAADLVQEVLLRVRRGLASYQPGSFEGWLWADHPKRLSRRCPEAKSQTDITAAG